MIEKHRQRYSKNKKVENYISIILLLVAISTVSFFVLNHNELKTSSNTVDDISNVQVTQIKNFIENEPNEKNNAGNFKFEIELALASSENVAFQISEENKEVNERVLNQFSLMPFEKTNLTIKQFNNLLKNTGLEGWGKSYKELEEKYNVNGVYAISVAMLESGRGYKLANKHNYYGMRINGKWLPFDSPHENIMFFGKLMNKDLYYGKTLLNIGKTYCPPTYESWTGKVTRIMRSFYKKRNND